MKKFSKLVSVGFLFVAGVLFSNYLNAQNLDINLLKQINPPNPNSSVWKNISSTAEPLCVAAPISMFAVSLINHDEKLKKNAFKVAGSLLITAVISEGMKIAINRDRPFVKYPLDVFPNEIKETGQSLPSGHTAFAFTTATSIYLAYPKWYVAVPAFTWASAVGYSRLYLGQHYPSDVIIGAIVGGGSACLTNWLNKKFIEKKKTKLVKQPS
ncbi:MAG: phosphatase PAP2 family protein [Chitinophagaceae bacterium]|nr:phosphatase PAP2 family protein [Chitinophagaceae bacterium]